MDGDLMRTQLDPITNLDLPSPENSGMSQTIRRYHRDISDLLDIWKVLSEDISDVAQDEELNQAVRELGDSIQEASRILGSWQPPTSKIHLVLVVEKLISDIRSQSLHVYQLVQILIPSVIGRIGSKFEELGDAEYNYMSSNIWKSAYKLNDKGRPNPEDLENIATQLSLSSNIELCMEAMALGSLKAKAFSGGHHSPPSHLGQTVPLVKHMQDLLLEKKQSQKINGESVPIDFCCPLSLELMSDPVILSSGQTYERVYIKFWLANGFTVCPKTCQKVVATKLVPNYTVKAMIANWCELNSFKLPDPLESLRTCCPSANYWLDVPTPGGSPIHYGVSPGNKSPGSPESGLDMVYPSLAPSLSTESHQTSVSRDANGSEDNTARLLSVTSAANKNPTSDGRHVGVGSSEQAHQRSSVVLSSQGPEAENFAQISGREREPLTPLRLGEVRSRGYMVWRAANDRASPKMSSSLDPNGEFAALDNQVLKLIEDLKSDSVDIQRSATAELRLLTKHNMENRILIANRGAIPKLVHLLYSPDLKIQENAVTAILNLSINDNNKIAITNADALNPLIHVLETGNAEAKENSAATLFSLSVIEENKTRIGRSGAIKALVDLLGNGTPRGKKDAATALFNLSLLAENKIRIVEADAVKHLLKMMDPALGMVDRVVVVIANLASITEGRSAISQAGGIPLLVDIVELGSSRGKENAASALLHLCTSSSRFCSMALREGAVPPLLMLTQSGTPRAKEKAQALLTYFRSQRHGNQRR